MGSNKPLWTQEYAKAQIKGEIKPVERAVLKKPIRSGTPWIAKGRKMSVAELRNNRLAYARPGKLFGIQWLSEIFPKAVAMSLTGKPLSVAEIKKTEYYKYLVAHLHPSVLVGTEPNRKGLYHVINRFTELRRLARSMKENGMTSPIDMFMDGKHPILTRGYRRLEILYQLGVKEVPVRFWRDEHLGRHYTPTQDWQESGTSIHGQAVKQFVEYGDISTDKYWVHNYTPYYDFFMRGKQNRHIKILELGVKKGFSLKLWADSFPKALVYGIDIAPEREWKKIIANPRITTINADIYKAGILEDVIKKYGGFDMIVDDAIHRAKQQLFCFKKLWGALNDDGVYVIEDVHHNYTEKNRDLGKITMDTFKNRADQIWTNHKTKEVCFFPNICFIRKA